MLGYETPFMEEILTGARQRTSRKAETVNITVRPTCRYTNQTVSSPAGLIVCWLREKAKVKAM